MICRMNCCGAALPAVLTEAKNDTVKTKESTSAMIYNGVFM